MKRKSNPIINLINSQIMAYKGQANEYSTEGRMHCKESRMLLRALYGPTC
jgi:hypothetical protein